MQHHSKTSVAVLVVIISFLPWFNLAPQTFAQTNNESVRTLITDAIENLQNNDTNTALTHSKLALQEISSSANASSSIDSVRILINDAIRDIKNGDTNVALTHLNLASQQFSLSAPTVTSYKNQSGLSELQTQPQSKNITDTSNFISYSFPAYGFSIKYPSSWSLTYSRNNSWTSTLLALVLPKLASQPQQAIHNSAVFIDVRSTSQSSTQ